MRVCVLPTEMASTKFKIQSAIRGTKCSVKNKIHVDLKLCFHHHVPSSPVAIGPAPFSVGP
jgi:hypothetical protein